MKFTRVAPVALVSIVSVWPQPRGGDLLADLASPKEGRIVHFSSADPAGGNADARPVRPGETYTIADYRGGPGAIRRWWMTVAPRNHPAIQRQCIIRVYWDGEAEPSVECPLSDFFGVGFGEWKDYQSAVLNMTSGGYNSYWPMPFGKSFKITFENRSDVKVDGLYYNLDVLTSRKAPKQPRYFHAQFRRADTRLGEPVTVLEATGSGHYVGTVLSMQHFTRKGMNMLEGDERFVVDNEPAPSIQGTGTEDYFSAGWYFDTGAYSALYHGCPVKDEETGRVSAYRWHIPDPVPFTKSLVFTMEHGPRNDAAPADYSSVAFWYQTHPHAKFPPLPADLLPRKPSVMPRVGGMIEAESLLHEASATSGAFERQDMSAWDQDWSGRAQAWWRPTAIGATLKLQVRMAEAGERELTGHFTRAADYGIVVVRFNGRPAGSPVNLYGGQVAPTGPVSLGKVTTLAGVNTIEIEVSGKDARSTGLLVGVDGFIVR